MKQNFICVYCGASQTVEKKYLDCATSLGKLIAKDNYGLVYGGGKFGLMGAVANSSIDNNGHVVGITTLQLEKTEGNQERLKELIVVDDMHTRKLKMAKKANAFVILPGGFGTLDEFFEILTWHILGIHEKPIFVIDYDNYWSPLKVLFHHIIDNKFASEKTKEMVVFVKNEQEAMEEINKHFKK